MSGKNLLSPPRRALSAIRTGFPVATVGNLKSCRDRPQTITRHPTRAAEYRQLRVASQVVSRDFPVRALSASWRHGQVVRTKKPWIWIVRPCRPSYAPLANGNPPERLPVIKVGADPGHCSPVCLHERAVRSNCASARSQCTGDGRSAYAAGSQSSRNFSHCNQQGIRADRRAS